MADGVRVDIAPSSSRISGFSGLRYAGGVAHLSPNSICQRTPHPQDLMQALRTLLGFLTFARRPILQPRHQVSWLASHCRQGVKAHLRWASSCEDSDTLCSVPLLGPAQAQVQGRRGRVGVRVPPRGVGGITTHHPPHPRVPGVRLRPPLPTRWRPPPQRTLGASWASCVSAPPEPTRLTSLQDSLTPDLAWDQGERQPQQNCCTVLLKMFPPT